MKRSVLVILAVAVLLLSCTFQVLAASQVTIRLMDKHLTEEPHATITKEMVAEFEKLHPNIKVILEPVREVDKIEKFMISFQAGVAPDVYKLTTELPTLVSRNMLMPMDNLIKAEGPAFIKTYYPAAMGANMLNKKVYAMPQSNSLYGMFYNTEMFKNAGLSGPPATWSEFLTASKKLTRDINGDGLPDQWGFALAGATASATQRFSCWLYSNDGDYLKLGDARGRETFKFVTELATVHKVVPPGAVSSGYNEIRLAFSHERAAMIQAGSFLRDTVVSDNPAMKDKFWVAPQPKNKGKGGTWSTLTSYAISSRCKNPKEAWELIKFITNKNNQIKWAKGTGFVVTNRLAAESPELMNDPYQKIFLDMAPVAKPYPMITQIPQLIDVVVAEIQQALLGKKTPDQAAKDAGQRIAALK